MGGVIGIQLASTLPEQILGIINFSMFPLNGLKVTGYLLETMEQLKQQTSYQKIYQMITSKENYMIMD